MRPQYLVALVPFRNEQNFLPAFFRGLTGIVDEIIGLDDGSTDESSKMFEDFGGTLIDHSSVSWSSGGEVLARRALLEAGRRVGGTHFLWLDVDEIPSQSLARILRGKILKLPAGTPLEILWVNAWKGPNEFRQRRIIRDPGFRLFAHADASHLQVLGDGLHFQKVPVSGRTKAQRIRAKEGAIIHVQYCDWPRARAKQAWYQVGERVNSTRSPMQISVRYRDTRIPRLWSIKPMPDAWTMTREVESLLVPNSEWSTVGRDVVVKDALELVSQTDMRRLEYLDVWDVPELRAAFRDAVGREPSRARRPILRNYFADVVERMGLGKWAGTILVKLTSECFGRQKRGDSHHRKKR